MCLRRSFSERGGHRTDRWTIGQYPRSWNKTNQTHAQAHVVLTTIQQSSTNTQNTISKYSSSSRYIDDTLTNKRLSAAGGSRLKQLLERTRHMCGHVIKTRSRLDAEIIMHYILVREGFTKKVAVDLSDSVKTS